MNATTTPIIDRPERMGGARRTAYGVATALAWFAYAYLLMPLLTLLGWFMGVRTAHSELFLRDNAIDPFVLFALPGIAAACALVLLGWAEYNRLRFQGHENRHAPEIAPQGELAFALGATDLLAERLRGARVALVAMDDASQLTTVNVHG